MIARTTAAMGLTAALLVPPGPATAQGFGETARTTDRVVGGSTVGETTFETTYSHLGSLQTDDKHRCAVTLMIPQYGPKRMTVTDWISFQQKPARMAITAAHCVFDQDRRLSQTPFLTVRSNSADLSSDDARIQKVARIEPHPAFDDDTLAHDIAVLILAAPAETAGQPTAALALPDLAQADLYQRSNTALNIAGWGRTVEGGPASDVLKQANVPYADQDKCRANHRRLGTEIPLTAFCAGFLNGGTDTCQGDSGGAITFQRKSYAGTVNSRNYLVGVVSWGIGCARDGLQGIYTDVLQHREWIEDVAIAYAKDIEPDL